MAVNPPWSPDGGWLALGVITTDDFMQTTVPALVSPESCQVV